jgi:hypothetical protein
MLTEHQQIGLDIRSTFDQSMEQEAFEFFTLFQWWAFVISFCALTVFSYKPVRESVSQSAVLVVIQWESA